MITVNTREDFLRTLKTFLPDNSFGVEIGTYRGEFAKMILDIIKPNFLTLIDPFEKNEEVYEEMNLTTAYSSVEDYEQVKRILATEIQDGTVAIIRDYSYNEVKCCPDGIVDFVYLDGSHKYLDVKKDLNDWLPKLADSGIMAGHDYADIKEFGVISAVNEFIREHNYEMIVLNVNGGDWALRKIK